LEEPVDSKTQTQRQGGGPRSDEEFTLPYHTVRDTECVEERDPTRKHFVGAFTGIKLSKDPDPSNPPASSRAMVPMVEGIALIPTAAIAKD
jgi:hypothetical protein